METEVERGRREGGASVKICKRGMDERATQGLCIPSPFPLPISECADGDGGGEERGEGGGVTLRCCSGEFVTARKQRCIASCHAMPRLPWPIERPPVNPQRVTFYCTYTKDGRKRGGMHFVNKGLFSLSL